jgi:hypothetical protein
METTLFLITLLSVAVAATMAAIAWRVVREERRRSSARIAALEAELGRVEDPVKPAPVGAPAAAPSVQHTVEAWSPDPEPWARAAPPADIFATTQSGGRMPRYGLVVLVVALLGFGAAALVTRSTSSTAVHAQPEVQEEQAQLELVSLRHERSGDTWTITGLVRNTDEAGAVTRLNAVAFLFDGAGSFLASGRSQVEFENLGPGEESPFVIRVESPGRVARYRVSFRSANGNMLKHVDRRSALSAPQS